MTDNTNDKPEDGWTVFNFGNDGTIKRIDGVTDKELKRILGARALKPVTNKLPAIDRINRKEGGQNDK